MAATPYDPRAHPPELRATDAEREAVAAQVRAAIDDGRLQLHELDERLGAVYDAKTHDELAKVIDDIVPRPEPEPKARPPVPDPHAQVVHTSIVSHAVVGVGESDRRILPAFLLCFFLGMFGAHRFYAGKAGSAAVMLVLTLSLFGVIVTGIWAFVDLIVLACSGFRDGSGLPMRRWT